MVSGYDEYEEEQKALMRHIPEDWELSILRWDSAITLLVDIIVTVMVFLIVMVGVAQLGVINNQQRRILELESKVYIIEQKTANLDVVYDYKEVKK